jgi:glycerate-2-kinase
MNKIQNFDALATTPLRRAALTIAEAGLAAIDTNSAIKNGVRIEGDTLFVRDQKFPFAGVKRLRVAAVGKCAVAASEALEEILGDRLTDGVAIDVRSSAALKKIKLYQGTHPMPSEANVAATAALVAMLKESKESDFVIFVISGGGSTLLSMPAEVGHEDEAKIVKALFNAGATIEEMNVIRKHLSFARGGYLAQYASRARSVALIFSDVVGDDLQFVASGPTVKDETTIEDAEKILAEYDVLKVCGLDRCTFVDTPKNDEFFQNGANILFVSNETALQVMRTKAGELGFNARICDACLSGEAAKVGVRIAKELGEAYTKTCFLYGGETTVTIRGDGKGGRNQELALAALPFIKEGAVLISLASDGVDNTDAAGGVCDTISKARAAELGLSIDDFLARNDSYNFWKQIGAQIVTGDTGSNVADLVIAIKE